jgi:hypothetical protein
VRRKRLILLGALLAVLAATTALASIGPAGPVIPVNTDTANFESSPDVAPQPGGSYTVVWAWGRLATRSARGASTRLTSRSAARSS